MTFKLINIVFQPDRFSQIKHVTYFFQCMKYFVRTGLIAVITDCRIPQHPVVFKFFCP